MLRVALNKSRKKHPTNKELFMETSLQLVKPYDNKICKYSDRTNVLVAILKPLYWALWPRW